MVRRVIRIDEEKCDGCGLCAKACHEGAIEVVEGKARLTREDYCDGLGDCLPACHAGAISFEERESLPYDEGAVRESKERRGCPGTQSRAIGREDKGETVSPTQSRLSQWPVQLKLAPVRAGYFDGADLLVAADCTAYAYGAFHEDFIKGRITLIGCPKLDMTDYAEKLTRILSENSIESVTVVRMEVPCCGGIENAVRRAIDSCGVEIPCSVVTVSTDGKILP